MKLRIAASIVPQLRARPAREAIHVHLDSDGRPFVCDLDRCESAALTPREIGLDNG